MKERAVLDQIIFPHSLIMIKIREYAKFLNKTYFQQRLSIITVLNGAAFFAVYLINHLTIDVQLDFIAISSYQANTKRKEVKFYKEIQIDVTDQHLLIVEDIIDSGQTCHITYQFCQSLKPKTMRFCSLVKGYKIKDDALPLPIDFLLTLPKDVWIVGFGIDFEEQFRNLVDIYSLKWSESKKLIKTN